MRPGRHRLAVNRSESIIVSCFQCGAEAVVKVEEKYSHLIRDLDGGLARI